MRGLKRRELAGHRSGAAAAVETRWLVLALLLLPVPAAALVARQDAGTIVAAILFTLGIGLSIWMMPAWSKRLPAAASTSSPTPLDAEIEEARMGLRHADAWMRLFPLGLLLAAMLKLSAFSAEGLHDFLPRLLAKAERGESTLLAALVLLVVLLHFVRRSLYFRARLRRLTAVKTSLSEGSA